MGLGPLVAGFAGRRGPHSLELSSGLYCSLIAAVGRNCFNFYTWHKLGVFVDVRMITRNYENYTFHEDVLGKIFGGSETQESHHNRGLWLGRLRFNFRRVSLSLLSVLSLSPSLHVFLYLLSVHSFRSLDIA